MQLGERLVQLRKEKNYTREEFAELLGISKYTLRNYELGVTEPGHPFLITIANMFDTTLDYILCQTDERKRMSSYELKSMEYEHIKKYRELDPHGKKMVDFTLNEEFERVVAEHKKAEKIIPMIAEESYLTPVAAHNDHENELGELEKMNEDISRLKRPE